MKKVKKTLLKGGSLASTYVVHSRNDSWVRKETNLTKEREYGFQRWYSQLKRLQRYERLFPNAFVHVRKFGMEGGLGFFDIDYYPTAINAFDFLTKCSSYNEAEELLGLITEAISPLHDLNFSSSATALSLFIQEEVLQKLNDARQYTEFEEIYSRDEVEFLGEAYPALSKTLSTYERVATQLYTSLSSCRESYTHGNLTLENILYLPTEHKILFIDPYEENIIDSPYQDYSQLLQSANSLYELYNQTSPVSLPVKTPRGLEFFNRALDSFLKSSFSEPERYIIQFFEAAQFIRMLPFKMKTSPEKGIFFYGLGSKLVWEFIRNTEPPSHHE